MTTLYSLPHSPYSARCRIAIYHKDLAIDIRPPIGGLRSLDYRSIVPTKKVPALITEKSTLVESSAILEYLEDRFPAIPLRGTSAEERAAQRALISFMDFSIAPQIFPLFQAIMGRKDANGLQTTIDTLQLNLASLETMFINEGRAENELDIADCALIPSLFYALFLTEKLGYGPLLVKHMTLQTWWQHRRQIPAVIKVLDEVETGLNHFLKAISAPK